jgi:uncharacterized protein YidB (DUF937 family)
MTTNDPLAGLGDLLGGLAGGGGADASGAVGLPPGLGDAIGGLLGGGAGGTAGLDDLVKGFQQAGLDDQVKSWIGTGPNQPVTPDQISTALGPDKVQQLSGSTGLDAGQLLPLLATFLPQIINALTPNGRLPKAGEDPTDALGGLLKGLGG